MENNHTCMPKKILFLVSLPSTKEFIQDKEDVEECVNELKEFDVDVRSHICLDVLADMNNYDIVIVMAHYDVQSDAMLLQDTSISMDDFVNCLPADFKGVLDLSICNSVLNLDRIKRRCPDCQIQVALSGVPLLRRVILYPSLVELLLENPKLDYFTAFNIVSNKYDNILGAISDDDSSNINMNLLGQRNTSVYAPKQVVKDKPFWIYLFFFYDEETGTVNMMVNDWVSGKVEMKSYQILLPLKNNGEVTATLNFMTKRPDHTSVMNGALIRHIAIRNTVVVEPFLIKVLPDYKEDVLKAEIRLSYDGLQFMTFSFKMDIGDSFVKKPADIALDNVIRPDDVEQILKDYIRLFIAKIINKPGFSYPVILKNGNNNKKMTEELTMKLYDIRKSFYSKEMYFPSILRLLDNINKELSMIQASIATGDVMFVRLISNLLSFLWHVQSDFKRLKMMFYNINGHSFDEAEREFLLLERSYLDAVSDLIMLHDQTFTLKKILLLKESLLSFDEMDKNISALNGQKEEIKKSVTKLYKNLVENGTDKDLLDIFKQGGTKTIIHSATKQMVSMPYLALAIAMAKGEYVSFDNGTVYWLINVLNYINLEKYASKESSRMPKLRINNTVGLLENKEIRESIWRYQMTKPGSISVVAYFLLNMKVVINRHK